MNSCLHDDRRPLFEFQPVTEKEVGKIIRSLPSNKAPGPDKVIARVLKDSLTITIAEITNLVNTSFSSNKFAQVWKLVEVISILKSGDSDEPSNTRHLQSPSCLRFAKGPHIHSLLIFQTTMKRFQNCKVVIGDSTRLKLLYFISQMKSFKEMDDKHVSVIVL